MTDSKATIAIIGGGFSGAAIAWHLARDARAERARVVIVEPRAHLGQGLAYSPGEPAYRINVPASKMSLDAGDIEDFSRWLAATDAVADDPDATLADGRVFPRRSVFGAYVGDRLRPYRESGRIEHLRAAALAVSAGEGGRHRIALDDGGVLDADILILAVTHPPPEPPARLAGVLDGHPRFVPDTTREGALDAVRADDRVLVVGTGLTGADVIAALASRGHRGPMVAISRRGLRSRGHPPLPFPPRGDFSSAPASSVRALLAAIHAELGKAEAAGETWHPVIDAVRSQGGAIWAALPVAERRRLVRHLRPFWDVHRFRVAPQVEAVTDRKLADGSLELFAASLADIRREGDEIVVTLRPRRGGVAILRRFDAVLLATGPGHGSLLVRHPLLASLAAQGLVRNDPAGLGIDTAIDGGALDSSGAPSPSILIGGPLARGTFGELMGLPEVAAYAGFIADQAAARLARGV